MENNMKQNTLSLKRNVKPSDNVNHGVVIKKRRKETYKKNPLNSDKTPPMPLVETWVWMTTNRENAAVRKEAELRLVSIFGSVDTAKSELAKYKADKELTKKIVTRSGNDKVTGGAPPSPLIKTWLEMISNRDSEEIRAAGKERLISAFGSLDIAIAYIENLPD
jgi:hypothetical protein